MNKVRLTLSAFKIGLPLSLVAMALFFAVSSSLSSETGAFLSSTVTAFNNPIGGSFFTPPAAPLFWVEEDMTQVKVDWLTVSDATGYKVYRDTSPAFATASVVFGGAATTFTDSGLTPNTDYFYKVTAVGLGGETPVGSITAKYAGTKEIVIDDDAQSNDVNASGTGAASGTGSWDKYATVAGSGVNVVPSILQNAVGGDNYSTNASATGQIYTWQTAANLTGQYDVYVQYICDTSRGIARYDVKAGSTTLNGSPIQISQNTLNGQPVSGGNPSCGGQASTSVNGPAWVKLGTFSFNNVSASVIVTAQAGEVNILADAVGFRKVAELNQGNLRITKYQCPADTPITTAQRPDLSGNTTVPQGCTPKSNVKFGYIYQADKNTPDISPPYPGLSDNASFTPIAGTTDGSGELWASGLSSTGRYMVAEIDETNHRTDDAQTLGFLCTLDQGTFTNNYEAAFIPNGGIEYCSVFNKSIEIDENPAPEPSPMSFITVANSPEKKIENRVQNGSFEDNLNHWNVTGDVELLNGSDGFTLPQDGNKMVRVGQTTNEGKPTRLNVLSQQIPAGVRTLGFYYNMFTYDNQGFDDPGFMVFVNDKMVFQRWASEVDRDDPLGDTNNLDSSGWQYFGIDLSKYPEGTTLTLAFYAGNDTLNLPSLQPHQSWVYLDNFSTNEAIVNGLSTFEIHTQNGDPAYYRIGSNPTIYTGHTFQLTSQPQNQSIYYWSAHNAVTEPTNSFHVLYDNVAPESISDLTGQYLENNLFELSWLSPRDDNQFTAPFSRPTNAAGYEIRYSTSPIPDGTDWSTLSPVAIVTEDGLPFGGYRAPKPEHEAEHYFVRTADSVNDYYFAIRSFDAATNWSAISNVAHISLDSPAVVNNDSDIVINEFVPNPNGDHAAAKPAGQWLELYNKSSEDKDVNGWAVYDEDDAKELIVSNSNSDNNLNPSDSGETVVPAHGYLIVYRNGDADFDLKSTGGDTIRLYNKPIGQVGSTLVDSYVYSADASVDKSFARIPDGSGSFVDPVPTPGRVNAAQASDLKPDARIWSQAAATAKLSIFDAVNYVDAHYLIEYTYKNNGVDQQGGMTGDLAIASQAVQKNDLYFGTCSNNVCVPHQDVDPATIKLTVTLTGPGIPDHTLTQSLTGSWAP